jgi:uncharacterized protein (TIGR00299 family) protein
LDIHLDLVGGLAGDMFIAALLDAFPENVSSTLHAIETIAGPRGGSCTLEPVTSEVMTGKRFTVKPPFTRAEQEFRPIPKVTRAESGGTDGRRVHSKDHQHEMWSAIRDRIRGSSLEPRTKAHALGIFELLAEAEAKVHGVAVDQVTFHEVGAWDSIADIVGSAHLIAVIDAANWSASPAPVGSGRVRSAHGVMPVPAPATVQLLMGMATIDDGVAGERVTPTGAAILRYLCPPTTTPGSSKPKVRTLLRSGTGFGRRRLTGISNHLRALAFEDSTVERGGQRNIHVLEFEVDDQSGEDLAMGLERLRAHSGALDVTQSPAFGKKGRMMTHVRVLARSMQFEEVIEACFRETTTIGLRHSIVEGIGLTRSIEEVEVDGHRLRVKVVKRPGGDTAKAESDDVLAHENHRTRSALRTEAERRALSSLEASDE